MKTFLSRKISYIFFSSALFFSHVSRCIDFSLDNNKRQLYIEGASRCLDEAKKLVVQGYRYGKIGANNIHSHVDKVTRRYVIPALQEGGRLSWMGLKTGSSLSWAGLKTGGQVSLIGLQKMGVMSRAVAGVVTHNLLQHMYRLQAKCLMLKKIGDRACNRASSRINVFNNRLYQKRKKIFWIAVAGAGVYTAMPFISHEKFIAACSVYIEHAKNLATEQIAHWSNSDYQYMKNHPIPQCIEAVTCEELKEEAKRVWIDLARALSRLENIKQDKADKFLQYALDFEATHFLKNEVKREHFLYPVMYDRFLERNNAQSKVFVDHFSNTANEESVRHSMKVFTNKLTHLLPTVQKYVEGYVEQVLKNIDNNLSVGKIYHYLQDQKTYINAVVALQDDEKTVSALREKQRLLSDQIKKRLKQKIATDADSFFLHRYAMEYAVLKMKEQWFAYLAPNDAAIKIPYPTIKVVYPELAGNLVVGTASTLAVAAGGASLTWAGLNKEVLGEVGGHVLKGLMAAGDVFKPMVMKAADYCLNGVATTAALMGTSVILVPQTRSTVFSFFQSISQGCMGGLKDTSTDLAARVQGTVKGQPSIVFEWPHPDQKK